MIRGGSLLLRKSGGYSTSSISSSSGKTNNALFRRLLSTEGKNSSSSSSNGASKSNDLNLKLKYAKTRAGTGNPEGVEKGIEGGAAGMSMIPRGPVSWPALGLVAVAAASAVAYYKIERERRLEQAMGKIVSSESGWSPNPEYFAKRKFKKTKFGWFPVEDAFGGGE